MNDDMQAALKPYQTDHLILLVGSNPLPNYVAAMLLTRPNAHLRLLTSSAGAGMQEIATRIAEVVQAARPDICCHTDDIVDVRDAGQIAAATLKMLKEIPSGTVGLHYTGGTKSMAVHVYRIIEAQFPEAVFSYLDADNLSLRIDPDATVPAREITLGDTVKITLPELTQLHGREIKTPKREVAFLPAASALAKLFVQGHAAGWSAWCETNLRRSDAPDKYRKKADLEGVMLPNDVLLEPVRTALGGVKTLGDVVRPAGWDVVKLAKWLHGKWLEHLTLDAIRGLAASCGIQDAAISIKPLSGIDFEFDVAALRGHQLFAISCTSHAGKELCKLKLFEAYVRARQFGGDEARVALVCANDSPQELQAEIEEAWFSQGKVRVFGAPDLVDLPVRLSRWFNRGS